MAIGPRRRARIVALQALFEADNSSHDPMESLQRIIESQRTGKAPAAFAVELVRAVLAKREELDGRIAKVAPAWPVDQLPAVDRNILRLAISEMLGDNGTPVRAAINEAVELAKTFGTEKSSSFVNGVLGSIAEELEQIEADQPTAKRG
ncbi:MAG: transcription antitermination factor NusB [Chloroflexi bacterium]|nr:transcription antitermination factor NusB [Chloroflexota bacterium]